MLTGVWGYQYGDGTCTVDAHVHRLRKKLPVPTGALSTIHHFGSKSLDVQRVRG